MNSLLVICLMAGFHLPPPDGNDAFQIRHTGILLKTDSTAAEDRDTLPSYIQVREIRVEGNKTTRLPIILRELLFKNGDTLSAENWGNALARSRENLINTSLFNFVNISWNLAGENQAHVLISVSERWYTWPVPIFEIVDRNFNEWWLSKDLKRTNYGFYVARYNFRGRNETVQISLREGYSQRYNIYYSIPYINKKQNGGLALFASYSRNHEIAYKTVDNTLKYIHLDHDFVRRDFSAGLRYTNRQGIYNLHTFQSEYKINQVADTVPRGNPAYFLNERDRQRYIRLTYFFKRDRRDIKAYPLHGFYYDFEINKVGLAVFNDDIDLLYFTSTFRKYFELVKRVYFAAGVKGKLSGNSPQPYSIQRALGYGNDFVRGYELFVVDGQNYGLMKSNLKFEIVRPRIARIPYLPLEKFNRFHYAIYFNLFADAGYVRDIQYNTENSLSNSLLIGTGLGLDYVTYYDMVFRLEYSMNKFGEKRFFLHFTAPI